MDIQHIRIGFRKILHESGNRWAKVVNSLLVLLIVFLWRQSLSSYSSTFVDASDTSSLFELVTVIIFSVEYVLRVWSAEHPLRYVFRGMALLIWQQLLRST